MSNVRARWLLIAVLAIGASACRNEEFVAPVERPPLLLRTSTPADSARSFYEPQGLPLSMTFRREILDGDVTTSILVPRPVSAGAQVFGANSPREWLWLDVVLDPAVNSYRWLVDGPSLVDPVIVTFHPGEPTRNTGRVFGELVIDGRVFDDARGALVYALRRTSRVGAAPLDSLLGMPIESIALVKSATQGREGTTFAVTDLVVGDPYLMVAILDTDDDGRYEPGVDWWGYPRDLALQPLEWTATAALDFEARPLVFEILRPSALDPADLPRAPRPAASR